MVIALDIFQTGVILRRWQKWLTETRQAVDVTGQILLLELCWQPPCCFPHLAHCILS